MFARTSNVIQILVVMLFGLGVLTTPSLGGDPNIVTFAETYHGVYFGQQDGFGGPGGSVTYGQFDVPANATMLVLNWISGLGPHHPELIKPSGAVLQFRTDFDDPWDDVDNTHGEDWYWWLFFNFDWCSMWQVIRNPPAGTWTIAVYGDGPTAQETYSGGLLNVGYTTVYSMHPAAGLALGDDSEYGTCQLFEDGQPKSLIYKYMKWDPHFARICDQLPNQTPIQTWKKFQPPQSTTITGYPSNATQIAPTAATGSLKGECVAFTQAVTHAPQTRKWKRGARAIDVNIAPGTLVATFKQYQPFQTGTISISNSHAKLSPLADWPDWAGWEWQPGWPHGAELIVNGVVYKVKQKVNERTLKLEIAASVAIPEGTPFLLRLKGYAAGTWIYEGHAALFKSFDGNGIWLWSQNWGIGKYRFKFVIKHKINATGNSASNPHKYYVVEK